MSGTALSMTLLMALSPLMCFCSNGAADPSKSLNADISSLLQHKLDPMLAPTPAMVEKEIAKGKAIETELTLKQGIAHNQPLDYKVITLPLGKLGVSFKGNSAPAIVSRVQSSSPLYGQLTTGMGVDTITVNGQEHMQMNAVEAADLLKKTSDVEGRVMELRDPSSSEFKQIPEELQVVLPSGKLGVTFTGSPPRVKSFKDNSPLAEKMLPGMFVDAFFMPDGYQQTGFTTRELNNLLTLTSEEEGRVLVLKKVQLPPSPKHEVFPDKLEVKLPKGKLSISFTGKSAPRIQRVGKQTPLKGKVWVGMVVEEIKVPGGSTFTGMTAEEVARVLKDTENVEGRILVLKSPEAASTSQ